MPQRKLIVTGLAQDDLVDIHGFTRDRHGPEMAAAYDGLIKQAFKDLVDDPFRPGGKERPEIGAGMGKAIRNFKGVSDEEEKKEPEKKIEEEKQP